MRNCSDDWKMKIFNGAKGKIITVFMEKYLVKKVYLELSSEPPTQYIIMTCMDFQRRSWSCPSQTTPAAGRWRFNCAPLTWSAALSHAGLPWSLVVDNIRRLEDCLESFTGSIISISHLSPFGQDVHAVH